MEQLFFTEPQRRSHPDLTQVRSNLDDPAYLSRAIDAIAQSLSVYIIEDTYGPDILDVNHETE